ncbi:hypothetical protein [Flavobacterium gelatinilyticum]|uniref:hypothetical protein n=1 Tax=Flavobacterium gelatinilyticum TaxID=3003260 RepID=UPI0024817606|nr:hypothetical protein [Flavobacterium gelatinilyticum]
MKFLYLLAIIISAAGCRNKSDSPKLIQQKDCIMFYDEFKNAITKKQKDTALNAINEAIRCDPNNKGFTSAKLRLLIELNEYKSAIDLIENYKSDDTSINMLHAVIKLKINAPESIDLLQKCYNQYNNEKEITKNNIMYKIALTNFFDGKEKALKEIQISKKTFITTDMKFNLESIEELINKYDKEKRFV